MVKSAQRLLERLVVGNSIPSLVRWGESMPPAWIRRLQEDAFREVFRYAARRQKFLACKLRSAGIDPDRVRQPADLGDIFTTPDDLLSLPPGEFLCREPEAVFETTG